jgi:hypothetical protein
MLAETSRHSGNQKENICGEDEGQNDADTVEQGMRIIARLAVVIVSPASASAGRATVKRRSATDAKFPVFRF